MKPVLLEFYAGKSYDAVFDEVHALNINDQLNDNDWYVQGMSYANTDAQSYAELRQRYGIRYPNTVIARDATNGQEIDRLECSFSAVKVQRFVSKLPAKPRLISMKLNKCWLREYWWAVAIVALLIAAALFDFRKNLKPA